MRSRPENRQSLIDLSVLLGLPAIFLVLLILWWHPWRVDPYEVPSGKDIFTVATGNWDWVNADSLCVANPYQISFTPDHALMHVRYARPWIDSVGNIDSGAVYDVQEHSGSHIRGLMHNETRLAEDGQPVIWDLVIMSPQSLVWRRTDWAKGEYTQAVVRCLAPPESPSSEVASDTAVP